MPTNKSQKKQNKASNEKSKAPKSKSTKSSLAVNTRMTSSGANFTSNGRGTLVSHKEVCRETFNTSTSFSVQDTIAIQPGIKTYSRGSPIGSWVPNIAQEYDYYTFKKLKFTYVTTASSLTNGMVIMSYDPNAEALAPTTFSSALNAARCVSGPVRENLTLDLTQAVANKKLMVRSGPVNSYPLYDAGRLFICSNAGSAVTASGYVVVEYTIQLESPQTDPNLDNTLVIDGTGPKHYIAGTSIGNGTPFYCGGANANRRMDTISALANSPSQQYGQRLVSAFYHAAVTSNFSYTSPFSNIVYNHSTSIANMNGFKVSYSGRYKVTVQVPGNFKNMAIFGSEILRMGPNASTSAALDVGPVVDIIQKVDGTYGAVPGIYGVTRGFQTIETLGNENDDLSVYYVTNCVLDTNFWYMIALGIRQVTGISENDDATYTTNSQLGFPSVEFEYLGPVDMSYTYVYPTPLV